MKNFTKYLLIGIMSTSVLISCSDDDETPVAAPSVESRLIGTWMVTALTVNPGLDYGTGVLITDLFAQWSDCDKDDLTQFSSNHIYIDDEGATKCDPMDPQVSGSGTWTLNADKTVISMSEKGSGYTEERKIENLTTSNLAVTNTEDMNGVTHTFTIVLKKQ